MAEVHLANWFFEGARADISKVISANPAFQLQHSFALGGQGAGKYNFGAIWTNNSVGGAKAKLIRLFCRVVWMGLER